MFFLVSLKVLRFYHFPIVEVWKSDILLGEELGEHFKGKFGGLQRGIRQHHRVKANLSQLTDLKLKLQIKF